MQGSKFFNHIINLAQVLEEPPSVFPRFLNDKNRGVPGAVGWNYVPLDSCLATRDFSMCSFSSGRRHWSTQTGRSCFQLSHGVTHMVCSSVVPNVGQTSRLPSRSISSLPQPLDTSCSWVCHFPKGICSRFSGCYLWGTIWDPQFHQMRTSWL